MNNKFGLYAINKVERLSRDEYPPAKKLPKEDTWTRTGLYFNGHPIMRTAKESNRFGLYMTGEDKELCLNGSYVADAKQKSTYGCTCSNDQVLVDKTVISRPDGVINITLDDYNTLRQGNQVTGYARYNDKAVYNIVNNVETAPNNIQFTPPEGIYDVIYNSYTDELKEYSLSLNTVLDVNTPSLDIRYVDQYGTEGNGITIEYFVDTKQYASLNKGVIGDTFSIIITDSYGNDIYYYKDSNNKIKHHTTYAGHFRIVTDPFKDEYGNNISGKTWFSIRCVDNHGRGSCEYFFSVQIRPTSYTEKIYDVTENDLKNYAITQNVDNDPLVAYKNRCGFARLIWDVYNNPRYNGIRFFNPNPNKDDLTSLQNYSYSINVYPDVKYFKTDRDLNNNDYKDRTESDAKLAYQKYYIFKYHGGDGTNADPATLQPIRVKPAGSNTYKEAKFQGNSAINWKLLRESNIADFEITPGKTFEIIENGKTRTVKIPDFDNSNEDILDWIWRDGAEICRAEDGRIIRREGGLLDYDSTKEVLIDDWRKGRCLRVISINSHHWDSILYRFKASYSDQVAPVGDKSKDSDMYPFKAGDGYYYVSFYKGIANEGETDARRGVTEFRIMNDFIIDFNYSSWKLYDLLLLQSATNLLDLSLCDNVEVRNGWIKGLYDVSNYANQEQQLLKLLRRGYVAQNIITMIPWEGCGLANTVAARNIKFSNMRFTGSLGYDIMTHAVGNIIYIDPYGKHLNQFVDTSGYININNGNLVKDSSAIIRNGNESLLPETSFDYVAGKSTDICMATTTDFIDISQVYIGGHKARIVVDKNYDATNTKEFDDEFVIGHWHNRYCVKYPEFFVHFYDSNQKYLRSIKTQINTRIKKIKNAAYIKVTMYLTGTLNNGAKVYLPENVKSRLERYQTYGCGISENITYDSCYFGISKSGMIEPTAINMCLNNCEFNNVNYTPKNVKKEHPYPMSSEEHGGLSMLFNINNSKIGYTLFENDGSEEDSQMRETQAYQIRFAAGGKFVNIKDSVGFLPYGSIQGLYIDNCWMNGVSCKIGPEVVPNAQVEVKHSKIYKRGSWEVETFTSGDLTYLTTGSGSACSASEDKVNNNYSLEGCFFNVPPADLGGIVVNARQYNDGTSVIWDSYISKLTEYENLWNKRLLYNPLNRDGKDGWVHMLVQTQSNDETIEIGYRIKDKSLIENNKLVVYIDGVKTTGYVKATYDFINIPTKGYHLVSYRLIKKINAGDWLFVPRQNIVTQFPKDISDSLSFAEALQVEDEDTRPGHEHDNDCKIGCPDIKTTIVMKSEVPVRLSSKYGHNVYIPEGATQAYYDYAYYYIPNKSPYEETIARPWRKCTLKEEPFNVSIIT